MNKNETIKQLTAAIDNARIKDSYGYEISTSETVAATLVEEGWGNVREYKSRLITTYLTEGAAGIMKIMMEEV
jgi:hypothetical protein